MSQSTRSASDISEETQDSYPGIAFVFSQDQTQLSVEIDPALLEQPFSREILAHFLKQADLEDFDLLDEAIDEMALIEPDEESEDIFTRVIAVKHNSHILIHISSDRYKAWLSVLPIPGLASPDRETLMDSLFLAGVTRGIKKEVIDLALEQGYLESTLVAEGRPPKKGQSAWFEYLVDSDQNAKKPQIREDGTFDYRELVKIQTVNVDTPLMRKHPPQPGVPGFTVTGKVLRAEMGRDYHMSESSGSRISEHDKNLLVAARTGRPIRMNRTVKVDDVVTLDNVDLQTGSVEFKGSVVVSGTVKSGFKVKADGDILVYGFVEDAILESGGNIEVQGSVFGRDHTSLSAMGDIRLNFVQNAQLECFGNLIVAEGIFHCEARVMGNIVVGQSGGKGQINGGSILGAGSLKTKILGSRAATQTRISVGEDPYLRQKLNEINQTLNAYKNELKNIVKAIIYIRTRAMDRAAELADLEDKRSELLEKVNLCSEQFTNLRESLLISQSSSEVQVTEELHSGVRIVIAEMGAIVREDKGPSRLFIKESAEGKKITVVPYSGRF
jgi:uncharacterized protein (DUF342 family)